MNDEDIAAQFDVVKTGLHRIMYRLDAIGLWILALIILVVIGISLVLLK